MKMKQVRAGANPTDAMLGAMTHTIRFHCIECRDGKLTLPWRKGVKPQERART